MAYQQQLRVCTLLLLVNYFYLQFISIFQIIYQQVLTLDLEYALDQKVEQDLWNHGFKNNINKLQQLAKDKKVPSTKLIKFNHIFKFYLSTFARPLNNFQ